MTTPLSVNELRSALTADGVRFHDQEHNAGSITHPMRFFTRCPDRACLERRNLLARLPVDAVLLDAERLAKILDDLPPTVNSVTGFAAAILAAAREDEGPDGFSTVGELVATRGDIR